MLPVIGLDIDRCADDVGRPGVQRRRRQTRTTRRMFYVSQFHEKNTKTHADRIIFLLNNHNSKHQRQKEWRKNKGEKQIK